MTGPNVSVRVCEWDRDVSARATVTIKTSRTDCDNARRGLRNDRTTLPPPLTSLPCPAVRFRYLQSPSVQQSRCNKCNLVLDTRHYENI